MKIQEKLPKKTFREHLMAGLGLACVFLGIMGIFLPILPTTPFILLAAWLFARSSKRFHKWLVEHPRFGPILVMWGDERGITRSVRNRILFYMWSGMMLSMLIVGKWWAIVMLSTIGLCMTIYLFRITTRPMSENV